ncbi:MAG: peptidylprolyl isomerase [Dehalococcoidia bacterium]
MTLAGMAAALAFVVGCSGGGYGTPATPTPTPTTPERGVTQRMQFASPPPMTLNPTGQYRATIRTNRGDVIVELFPQEAPKAVNSFVFLARQGFYDGVVFHRIIRDFMIQGGDPTGTGRGGPGYTFEDEPVSRDYVRGTLAMANAGPDTNGSQFFIVHQDVDLPKQYTIFGLVIEGMETVDTIANTPVTRSPTGEASVPTERIVIESIEIEELAPAN